MSPRLLFSQGSVKYMWRAVSVTLFACILAGPGDNYALGQWQQTYKLTADDAAQEDWFGLTIAISGNIAVVGAPQFLFVCPNEPHCDTGAIYLFDITTGHQFYSIVPADAAPGDQFGSSVSVSGNILIVGAPLHDEPSNSAGAAYLFDISNPEAPVQLHKLTADDATTGDRFGTAVAIDGDVAIIGADADSYAGFHAGSAYLFDVTTGDQLHKLIGLDTEDSDQFGFSVALDDGVAVVGAVGDDDEGMWTGSAYLFDVATGQQLHKLLSEDAAAGDQQGFAVAIQGNLALVGAWGSNDACPENPYCNSGSAYLFDVATGQQLEELTPDDAAEGDLFGSALAIRDGLVAVGAGWTDDLCPENPDCDSGAAYLFDITSPGSSVQLHKFTADDAGAEDWFGVAVALSDNIALVGAIRDDDACPEDPGCDSGAAYVFAQSAPCPEDFDGDGLVGPYDLAIVLGYWGPNPGHPADLDGDGYVGPFDLALVLGYWGPCS